MMPLLRYKQGSFARYSSGMNAAILRRVLPRSTTGRGGLPSVVWSQTATPW